jgi:hypothetical protein
MSFIPGARNAQVDPRKLRYLVTSGKARFFTDHGFDPSREAEWIAALRQHP